MTIEGAVPADAIAALYFIYTEAFGPMRTRAAARHLLSADEFSAEMADPRIEKYVVWAEDGSPLALTTMTRDLSAVPWISPEFYTARYPAHAARGALFYLGYTLVRPGRDGHGLFTAMLDQIVERMVRERAVCVFDVSAYNDGRTVGKFVAALPDGRIARVEAVDVQTFYGVTFDDLAGPGTGTAEIGRGTIGTGTIGTGG